MKEVIGAVVLAILFGLMLWIVILYHKKPKGNKIKIEKNAERGKNLNSVRGAGEGFSERNGNKIRDAAFCGVMESGIFKGRECNCKPPFFGEFCDEESFDPKYFDAGSAGNFSGGTLVNRLSYPYLYSTQSPFNLINQTFCTGLCDQDLSCRGVYYTQGESMGVKTPDNRCVLLKDSDLLDKSWTFSDKHQNSVFLKSPPKFSDRAVVFIDLPKRFYIENSDGAWNVLQSPTLIQLRRNSTPAYPIFMQSDFPGKIVLASSSTFQDPIEILTGPVPARVDLSTKNWTSVYGKFIKN